MHPQKFSIITVDDEPIVHLMLEQIIEETKLPVYLAGKSMSADEAVHLTESVRPDICLLDINMDGMNGLELGRKLQSKPDYTPQIIYLTAYDRFEYAQNAIKIGAVDYLLKPINKDDVVNALSKVVNKLEQENIKRNEFENIDKRLKSIIPDAVIGGASQRRTATIAGQMLSYIREHFAEEISLASIAENFNLSPNYASEIFRKETGISFKGCLKLVRITKAKELMQDQTLNLSEIAQAVGYDNVNYFSQTFLEETGVRPGEYRGGGRNWAK